MESCTIKITGTSYNTYLPISIYLIGYDSGYQLNITFTNNDGSIDYKKNCKIYCVISDACINLDSSYITTNCSIIYSDTLLPTQSPTNYPTTPTIVPSAIPSYSPTIPTAIPTNAPITVRYIEKDNNFSITHDIKLNLIILGAILGVGLLLYVISKWLHGKRHREVKEDYQRKYLNYHGLLSDNLSIILDYDNGFGVNSSHYMIFTILLVLVDFYSDILYCIEIIATNDNNGVIFLILFVAGLLIEVSMNCYFIYKFYKIEINKNIFATWFQENTPFVHFFGLISIFEIKILNNIFTSQLFGNKLFYAPLSRVTISNMQSNSIYIVLFGHLPQLVIQILYLFITHNNINFATIFAISITCIDLVYDVLRAATWSCLHTTIKMSIDEQVVS